MLFGLKGVDADKRKGLMSMAYGDFASLMADVDKAFSTWDKVMLVWLTHGIVQHQTCTSAWRHKTAHSRCYKPPL